MAISIKLQLPWLCRQCILMLRGGLGDAISVLILDAAADRKNNASPEDFLHVVSTRTVLCAHRVQHMLVFSEPRNLEDNAFVAPALPAKALLSKVCCMSLPLADQKFPPTINCIYQADI